MTDIVAFLTARLDEDQAAAEAAQQADPTPWTVSTTDEASTYQRNGRGAGLVIAADEVALWDCEGSNTLCMTAPAARHVARQDPARVLAEVSAKRQLIDKLGALGRVIVDEDIHWHRRKADEMLRLLALPYADHPDYDESWALPSER